MNFPLALRRCRIKDQQGKIGTALHGKGGKFQVELTHLRVVNALIAFSMTGDVMALPKTGELDALLAELRDQLVSFFRGAHPRDVGAEGIDDKLPHPLPVLQSAAASGRVNRRRSTLRSASGSWL